MAKISIIVPVYNVEEYLKRCMDSLLKQINVDIKIICIDDGSTDRSGVICDEYAVQDNRVISVHKENGGVASARNLGLKYVEGDYVGFVDPDDWVESDMYYKIIQKMEAKNADLGICAFYKDWDDRKVRCSNDVVIGDDVFDREKVFLYALKRYDYKGFAVFIWNKVFKKDILLEDGICRSFNEELEIGEDVQFLAEATLKTKRAIYVDEALYHYYQRDTSLCHAGNFQQKKGPFTVYENLIDVFRSNGISEEVVMYAKRFCAYHASLLASYAFSQDEVEHLNEMQNVISKYIRAYEATSGENENWNHRMRLMMRDPERAIAYTRNEGDAYRREAYWSYLQCPVEEKWILYEAFFGRGMIGSPYAIFNEFQQRSDFSDYMHIWSISDEKVLGELEKEYKQFFNIKFVLRSSVEYTEYLAKSKYLINNNNFFYFFTKRDEQIYLNTWHGIPMKTLGYDVPGGILNQHNTYRNLLMADYVLAWCDFMAEAMQSAYMLNDSFKGKIVLEGCPRNDILLQKKNDDIYLKLNAEGIDIKRNRKVVLYAPTFRGTSMQEVGQDYLEAFKVLELLNQHLSEEYQVIYKPHHLVSEAMKKKNVVMRDVIYSHLDTDEILKITDILITDYSSIFFDYLLLDRPIIFFVPDENEYMEYRGLYFNTTKVPGEVCHTVNELVNAIENSNKYMDSFANIHKNFKDVACELDDGKVSARVLDILLGKNNKYRTKRVLKEIRKRILIVCGSLHDNQKYEKFLNLVDKLQQPFVEIVALIDEPKSNEDRKKVRAISGNVRGLVRVTAFVQSNEESIIFEKYMDGEIEYNSEIEAIFKRERSRCLYGLEFDEVHVLENEPFSNGMLRVIQNERKSKKNNS